MKYFSRISQLPTNLQVLKDVDAAAQELARRLSGLDVDNLHISNYNRRYLKSYLNTLYPVLRRYSFVMSWGLAGLPIQELKYEKLVLLDYGGGTGLMCLLAKMLGIGTVLYSDYYDVSCRDAMGIARETGLEADSYIHGEIQEVIRYVKEHNLSINVLANNDVIEHIYDLNSFIAELPRLSETNLSVALATGANAMNPYEAIRLMRLQWLREHRDRKSEIGCKEMDTNRAYRSVRAEIVREFHPRLAEPEIEMLAAATRGKARSDVERDVERFLHDGSLPVRMKHPTNTCDPISGSWAEHLIRPNWITTQLERAGFRARVIPGPYGWRKSASKRWVAKVLDRVMVPLGPMGVTVAPYVVFVGSKIRT